jgi:hypothetical protein
MLSTKQTVSGKRLAAILTAAAAIILIAVLVVIFSHGEQAGSAAPEQSAAQTGPEAPEQAAAQTGSLTVSEYVPLNEVLGQCGLKLENPTAFSFSLESLELAHKDGKPFAAYILVFNGTDDMNAVLAETSARLSEKYGVPTAGDRWICNGGTVELTAYSGVPRLEYAYPLAAFDFGRAAEALLPRDTVTLPEAMTGAVRLIKAEITPYHESLRLDAYDQSQLASQRETWEKQLQALGLKAVEGKVQSDIPDGQQSEAYLLYSPDSHYYILSHKLEKYEPGVLDTVTVTIHDKEGYVAMAPYFPAGAETRVSLNIVGKSILNAVVSNNATVAPSAVADTALPTSGVIDVDVIKAAYAKDEKAPEYTGKVICVRGMLRVSVVEMDDFVTMALLGSDSTPPVDEIKCYFSSTADPDLAAQVLELKSGEMYTVTGTCQGLAEDTVILTDCILNDSD